MIDIRQWDFRFVVDPNFFQSNTSQAPDTRNWLKHSDDENMEIEEDDN